MKLFIRRSAIARAATRDSGEPTGKSQWRGKPFMASFMFTIFRRAVGSVFVQTVRRVTDHTRIF